MNGLIENRIVVKVGTSTLTHAGGEMNLRSFDKLARVLADIRSMGRELILVSSGAIAAGASKLRMAGKPSELRLKQAAAAVGQSELMHLYGKFFGEYGKTVGQILLTREDVRDPYIAGNLISTFDSLLELGAIPVVNENDSVCFAEIESDAPDGKVFGDNDTLSAVVAVLCRARRLVLLSDIDGFYDGNPRKNPEAKIIGEIGNITDAIRSAAGGAGSQRGTGGMITKLMAAETAMDQGIDMFVINGQRPELLYDIIQGGRAGTMFVGKKEEAENE